MVIARINHVSKLKFRKMKKDIRRTIAYSEESYPPMPTKSTLFWRRCIIFQAWRWVVLNIKILRIVVGGHS